MLKGHSRATCRAICLLLNKAIRNAQARNRGLQWTSIVFFSLLIIAAVDANFLVVFLEGGGVLARLAELSLLHSFADVPVDEGALGVEEVELVVQTGPGLGDGGGVGEHTHCALHLCEVAAGHDGGWLVVDADLESGGAPVDELNGPFGLDGSDGSVDVLGRHVAAEEHTAGHVLAVARVALHHLVIGLEAFLGKLLDIVFVVSRVLSADDGSVAGEREVDAGVGNEVGLELGEVDVEGTVKAEGGSDGADDLSNDAVEIGVSGSLDAETLTADVVDGFVVNHEGNVGVLEGGVGGEDGVVGLDDGGGDLRRGVDAELELWLLPEVG